METALYYYFSTIAQTFATALGLLAAFVLYRLQVLEGKLEDLARYAAEQHVIGHDEIYNWIEEGLFEELMNHMKKNTFEKPMHGFLQIRQEKFYKAVKQKKHIITYFTVSLINTVFIIAVSIFFIPFVPFIFKNDLTNNAIVVIFLLVIICLTSYIFLIRKALFGK